MSWTFFDDGDFEAKLRGADREGKELEKAYDGQITTVIEA